MVSDAVKRMREAGKAHLAKKKSGGGSSSGLTREEIAEVERRTAEVISEKSPAEQRAELARAERLLGGRGTAYGPSAAQVAQAAKAAAAKAAELQRIEQAKSFAEKTRIAREIVMTRQAQAQFQKILNARSNLIKRGVTEFTRSSTNRAGDKLEVSQWRDKFGNRVERIKNLDKDTTTFSSFAKIGKNGVRKTGRVVMSSAPTTKESASVMAGRIKITSSNIPGKVVVTFPNGQTGTISSKGRVVVGARLTGNKYTFQDGKIVQVDDKWADGRDVFVPSPTVERIEQPTGIIARNIKKLNDIQKVRATSSIRSKQTKIKNELKLLGVTTATTVIAGVSGIIGLPSTLMNLAKNPSQILEIPGAIRRGGKSFGQLIRTSPTEAFAKIAGEILFLKGVGKVSRVVGKVSPSVTTRLNPYFKKVNKGEINIKTTKGKTTLEIGIIGKGVPLKKQVKLSGKKLEAAATVQADAIINFIKNRKRVIRKPIPGEETLTQQTKSLLKKFDNDKINRKDFFELNKRLIKETGDKTLLERSLFLDPKGKVRFTRLVGDQPEAGIIDILSGDFTFKTPKPQILVFSDIPVAKFPARLRDVAKKLRTGKTLTEIERIRLVEWQLKKSGKLKPIGDVRYRGGVELEVTIAPGELIKRVKKLGVTLINGKKVDIIEARIFKPNPKLNSKILKANKGALNKKQLKALEKELERATGFKSKTVRRTPTGRRRARLPTRGLRIGSKAGRGRLEIIRKLTKRPVKRPTKRPPKRPVKRKPGRPTKRPPKRPPKRPVKRPPRRPPIRKPPIIPIRLPSGFKKRKLKKAQSVFYIKVKRKGRMVNLIPRPLVLKDAKNLLAYRLDKRLLRTAYFEPLGKTKNVMGIPPKMKGYFTKVKHKLRPYKIKVGKKKLLRTGFIEKKKFVGDTRSEILELSRSRINRKSVRKPVRRKPRVKKKITKKVIGRPVKKAVRIKPLTPIQRRSTIIRLRKQRAMLLRQKRKIEKKRKK